MKTTNRIKCPSCSRMAGQLTHNVKGEVVGYTRSDGSSIYRCPWQNCVMEDFRVDADGHILAANHAKAAPGARRALEAWADKYLGGP